MYRRLMYVMVTSLLTVASATSRGGEFVDDFSAPHDYLTQGVTDTGWDGFIGQGAGQTVSVLDASTTRSGELYMASANGSWPGTTLGPFLYKLVSGDFVATVRVTNYVTVAYNYCGLMARIPALADAGAGEDWVAVDYFPQYGCGIIAHNVNNGTRGEDAGGNGTGTTGPKYLQLERKGNVFTLRSSYDGVTWTDYPDTSYSPVTRADMEGLAVQVGVWQGTFSANAGDVAFDDFRIVADSIVAPSQASRPVPATKATDVVRDMVLSWKPTEGAVQSDVYFGTSVEAVTAAGRTNQQNVLVSQAQDANTYDPIGVLAYGQTYYWRVDGVDASGAVIAAGEVWSFTVEPVGYPIASASVTAVASSFEKGRAPGLTVDGAGMNGDLAGIDTKTMWTTISGGASTAWIQYTFDKIYKMQEVWVWNYNSESEPDVGYGIQDVTIQYSADADPNNATWTTLGDFVFEQAPGMEDAPANPPVLLNGVAARQIKFVVKSIWNPNANPTKSRAGLTEVRFYYLPVWPREPEPDTGSLGVEPVVTLGWRAGREAATHNVYIGTDSNAVRDNLVTPVASNTATCTPPGVDLGATYYWKVDEVNAATTPTTWAGPVWSFTTPAYFTVDDFERYSDSNTAAIFNSWADGYGTTNNGAQVGNDNPPFAETTIVHGGRQAMPFIYGKNNIATSEATHTFPAAQDWTRGGIKTLVIFFRGIGTNVTPQLYVKINGIRVNYTGDASALAAIAWKQWNVDLTSVAGVAAVNSLTIGVAGTGSGTLYFDDIRLYKTAPVVAAPVDPGTANLMASFTMEGSVTDTSGHSYTGTLYNLTFSDSLAGLGKAAQFNGSTAYVDMGSTFSSSLLKNLTSCTFAVWVNYPTVDNIWGRIFDFGISQSSSYVFLAMQNGNRLPQFTIRTATVGERTVTGPWAPSSGWHHLAGVIDASGTTPTMTIYVDGEQGTSRTGHAPRDMGDTTNNWLGRSQYQDADPYLNAAIDEFRIYNRVLTAGEIRYLAGNR